MGVESVWVNHVDRNYFNDYDEICSDTMVGCDKDKLMYAIGRLHMRFIKSRKTDVLFIKYDDGTGYRLMYDRAPWHDEYELRLRHFINMRYDSWDTDETVTVSEAKRRMAHGFDDEG